MNRIDLLYYNHRSNVCPTHITKRPLYYYDLTVVLKGVLYYVCDDSVIPVKAGNMIFLRPEEYRQRLDSEEPSDYISFNFDTDMDLSILPTEIKSAVSNEISQLIVACDGFFFSRPDRYSERIAYLLGAILLQIMDSITDSQINPLALRIKNMILQNYSSQITLQSIASEMNYSQSYCTKVFKKETGKAIVDYLIDIRMKFAMNKLVNTDFSLTRIAAESGYDDYNYFCRLFKKHTKYTPMQYRKIFSDIGKAIITK